MPFPPLVPFRRFLHRYAVPVTAADGRLVAFVTGVLLAAWLPVLPPNALWPLLPCLMLLAWRGRPAGSLAAALGLAWACLHGQALLAQRLPPACDGHSSALTGTIAGLPQRHLLRDGSWQQRVPVAVDAVDEPASALVAKFYSVLQARGGAHSHPPTLPSSASPPPHMLMHII